MTFKTTLKSLLKKAKWVYINGLIVCKVDETDTDGLGARIGITESDPEYPDTICAKLNQEVEINENGVGTIQICQPDAADDIDLDDKDATVSTEDATIECMMYRPMVEGDLTCSLPSP